MRTAISNINQEYAPNCFSFSMTSALSGGIPSNESFEVATAYRGGTLGLKFVFLTNPNLDGLLILGAPINGFLPVT